MAAIDIDGKFFIQNGRRFVVRGVTYGTFAPRRDGARFPISVRIGSDMEAMHDAGFNVVRTYTEPPSDLIQLAADGGMAVLAGVHWNDWRYLIGASRRQHRSVARSATAAVGAAARHLAGSDTVLALCVGNEVPADVIRWVGTRRVAELVRELADVVREVDDKRLVTYANYPSAEYLPLEHLDFLTFNLFVEQKADLRRYLTRLHHLAGDRPLLVGEIGAHSDPGCSGEAVQAAELDWQLDTAFERGVAGTCIFSWTDDWHVGGSQVEGWRFGLTRADRSPRPALGVAEKWNRRTVADLPPGDRWPSISVVICAYNAEDTLDECLEHTCALEYDPLEIIVVDDGSSDATASIVARHRRARLLRVDHGGLATARNAGFEAALSEVIAYLDADAYPSPEWPYFLALGFDGRTVGGVGGPNVSPSTDPLRAQQIAASPGGPAHVLLSDDRAEHLPGCNMAFWRDVLVEVAGFEPVYTTAGDDVDLCWRVLDRGWEIGFHPAALVWHHRRATVRSYLRQQIGYGRAEALVAARHPDRFTRMGGARWRGRIYGARALQLGRARIYRGAYGSAAFQSVYRSGGTMTDLLHQAGIPTAAVLILTAPLILLSRVWMAPAGLAAAFLLTLLAFDTGHVLTPSTGSSRLAVAGLTMVQPIARTWGRARHGSAALRDLPSPPPLIGPTLEADRSVLLLPGTQSRPAIAAAIVESVRRTGASVRLPTGWEDHDAEVLGSFAIAGSLVTVGEPGGIVQMRVRRRLRVRAFVAIGAIGLASLVSVLLAVILAALVLVEMARGWWRTGPALRRAVMQAATARGNDHRTAAPALSPVDLPQTPRTLLRSEP